MNDCVEGTFKRSSVVCNHECFPSPGMFFCKGISFIFSGLHQWADAISTNPKWQRKHVKSLPFLSSQHSYSSCHSFGRIINRTQMTINSMWLHLVSHRFQYWLFGRIMRKIWCQSLPVNATAHHSKWLNSIKKIKRETCWQKDRERTEQAPTVKIKKNMLMELWKEKFELWHPSALEHHGITFSGWYNEG